MKKLTFKKIRFGVAVFASILLPMSLLAKEKPGFPFEEHIDQHTIDRHSSKEIYDWGKKLFEAPYNHLDGVGLNMRDDPIDEITLRFARSPRADLSGWLADPVRLSGPAARNCRECHNSLSGNILNTIFDFARLGDISNYVERQTSNIAGAGALQLLAEQTSKELWAIRDGAIAKALDNQEEVTVELLSSNKVSYGEMTAFPDGTLDVSSVAGVGVADNPFKLSKQFQVSPFFAKSEVGFIRITSANPPNGMQSVEQYPEFLDADHDGIIGEMSVGDITAITIYTAAQPRPVSKIDLHNNVGGKFKLSNKELHTLKKGMQVFEDIGCADCHRSKMVIDTPVFNEPSSTPGFSFPVFWGKYFKDDGTPGFTNPLPYGYDVNNPVSFSLSDLPSIPCKKKNLNAELGKRKESWNRSKKNSCWREYETNKNGGVVLHAFSDQKLHDLGVGLSEGDGGFGGVAGSVWRTKELWGVGSTGPWLHDGRATTLTEAIKWHDGEAADSRLMFYDLEAKKQDALIEFLESLVIYNPYRNAIQPSGNGFVGG